MVLRRLSIVAACISLVICQQTDEDNESIQITNNNDNILSLIEEDDTAINTNGRRLLHGGWGRGRGWNRGSNWGRGWSRGGRRGWRNKGWGGKKWGGKWNNKWSNKWSNKWDDDSYDDDDGNWDNN